MLQNLQEVMHADKKNHTIETSSSFPEYIVQRLLHVKGELFLVVPRFTDHLLIRSDHSYSTPQLTSGFTVLYIKYNISLNTVVLLQILLVNELLLNQLVSIPAM